LKDEAFVRQTTEKARELTEKVKQLASETLLLVNRSINGA
jgi:hypothetical protein